MSSFALSPNGKYLAIGGQNNGVFYWNMETKKIEEVYEDEHRS